MIRKAEKYNSLQAVTLTDERTFSSYLHLLLELVKFRITVLVSFTTALGYFLSTKSLGFNFIYPVLGIFLLACSSAALNQLQEIKTDLMMNRTKDRPLPSGRISFSAAMGISLFLLIIGSAILFTKTNIPTLLTGLLTFYWYNGVYTPLKKKTALAIIPGSLVGALPPLAGWLAAGGNLFSKDILIIASYFFVWQIPHFWLLLLLHSDDFKKGNFPVLTDTFSSSFIKKITFALLVATIGIGVVIPLAGISHYIFSSIFIYVFSAAMLYASFDFVIKPEPQRKDIIKTFVYINIYTLLIITILSADKLFYLL